MSEAASPPEGSGKETPNAGNGFIGFIPPEMVIPELTLPAVLVGAILGIVFGASSLYLVLKVGMTVSASIPIAVLSITLFRAFSQAFGMRKATILENNIVQTTGSAGESIAFGVGVTMPALLILGFDIEPMRVILVATLGGLLGILMMIPLRKAFIVNQHGQLPYPEGTACAKVLIAGEQGGSSATKVFIGFGVAFVYKTLMQAMGFWKEAIAFPITGIKGYDKAVVGCEVSPELMGVGYIIGPKIAGTVVAGGFLSSLVLLPMMAFFGASALEPIFPGTKVISESAPKDLTIYLRYIGAGAVATGGFISMIRAMPLIVGSAVSGMRDLRGGGGSARLRTDKDMPFWIVGVGAVVLVALIAVSDLIPTDFSGRLAGSALIVLLGFLFVTVSSRMTGEIGSSSNPISGMTIATLLITCLAFVLAGWVGPEYRLAALCIAGIVCIASSNGGTTSQDLKTGFLVGATPWAQQVSILVGALTSALVIGFTLLLLNQVNTVYSTKSENLPAVLAPVQDLKTTQVFEGVTYKVWVVTEPQPGVLPGKYLVDDSGKAIVLEDPAFSDRLKVRDDGKKVEKYTPPQASLFALIINGIMQGKLPWGLVLLGVFLAIVVHLAGVSALAFAVGVYLPLATTFPIFIGGLIRAGVDRYHRSTPEESDTSPAVLLSSGFIAGGSIAGILIAFLAAFPTVQGVILLGAKLPDSWQASEYPALFMFLVLVLFVASVGCGWILRDRDNSKKA